MSCYASSSHRPLTDDEIFTPPAPDMILGPDDYWHRHDPEMDAPQIGLPPRFPRAYLPYMGAVYTVAWFMFRGSGQRFPAFPGERDQSLSRGDLERLQVNRGWESRSGNGVAE